MRISACGKTGDYTDAMPRLGHLRKNRQCLNLGVSHLWTNEYQDRSLSIVSSRIAPTRNPPFDSISRSALTPSPGLSRSGSTKIISANTPPCLLMAAVTDATSVGVDTSQPPLA